MFIVGTIVFTLYVIGFILMNRRENELQKQRLKFKNSRIRKINTSDFNGHNIDSSILRSKARRRIIGRFDKFTESEEINCEYSGLPSPKAYNKKIIGNQ